MGDTEEGRETGIHRKWRLRPPVPLPPMWKGGREQKPGRIEGRGGRYGRW